MRTLLLGLIIAAFAAQPALASTDCDVYLEKVFAGDEGNIWLHYTNGGSGYLLPTDPDKQAATAMAITALATGRPMTVRYAANGVACTTFGRSDVTGVYLR